VDDGTLEFVLEAARWAPSWANTQCWRFIVVPDKDIKDKLADTLNPTNSAIAAIKQAPLLIVACAELKQSGCYDGVPVTDKGDWFMFDVALAMQNLVLTAHSLGLATLYVGRFDAKEAASILKVPSGFCVVSMTPLGYSDQERSPRPRKELSEIVFHNKFGVR
jgi:nitroreductase